ncbi:hypothetical protein V9T40_005204 [Parthenolecanium corni]|uniref:Uncharacterized protein n=1 Tax=Parthenolecanium corni TaxID=536013 RepID=A0AAN9TUL0_9HEMI
MIIIREIRKRNKIKQSSQIERSFCNSRPNQSDAEQRAGTTDSIPKNAVDILPPNTSPHSDRIIFRVDVLLEDSRDSLKRVQKAVIDFHGYAQDVSFSTFSRPRCQLPSDNPRESRKRNQTVGPSAAVAHRVDDDEQNRAATKPSATASSATSANYDRNVTASAAEGGEGVWRGADHEEAERD